VEDYAHALYRQKHGGASPPPGPAWVTAHELTPEQHLAMQAALQPHVDSAISKTINCPVDIDPVEFGSLYMRAYDLGLKGCTTFRPNPVTGAVLVAGTGFDNLRSDDYPICKSPRTKPDGSCRVCLDCGRSLCA